jgi:hypothetical protein
MAFLRQVEFQEEASHRGVAAETSQNKPVSYPAKGFFCVQNP